MHGFLFLQKSEDISIHSLQEYKNVCSGVPEAPKALI